MYEKREDRDKEKMEMEKRYKVVTDGLVLQRWEVEEERRNEKKKNEIVWKYYKMIRISVRIYRYSS